MVFFEYVWGAFEYFLVHYSCIFIFGICTFGEYYQGFMEKEKELHWNLHDCKRGVIINFGVGDGILE